jgi:hypothetical protein
MQGRVCGAYDTGTLVRVRWRAGSIFKEDGGTGMRENEARMCDAVWCNAACGQGREVVWPGHDLVLRQAGGTARNGTSR